MDPEGSSGIYHMNPLVPRGGGANFFSQFASIVNNTRYSCVPGCLALQEAFNRVSTISGALIIWLGSNNSSIKIKNHKVSGDHHGLHWKSNVQIKHAISCVQNFFGFFSNHQSRQRFWIKQFFKEVEQLPFYSALSLAASLIPPFDKALEDALAVPVQNVSVEKKRSFSSQRPCEVENHENGGLYFQCLGWNRLSVEPRTGIEFPTLLDNNVDGENHFSSEVLVGTGSRTMKIIKIKSLKIYAFGFYVHPFDICEKLGPKYASVPVYDLDKCPDFYRDLLREDISMTVRLVVSCNGIKLNNVKDAFEKSLRIRLAKTNPDTDYACVQRFGSIFSQDIPVHVGTTINFHRTADGCLITETGGNQIGVVQSKDLCRAFFDMYIGDIPVSQQTKEEIGRNVASIMRSC